MKPRLRAVAALYGGLLAAGQARAALIEVTMDGLITSFAFTYDSYWLQRSALRGRVLAAKQKWAKQIRVHAQRLAAGEAPASVLGRHPGMEHLRRLRRLEKTTCTAIRRLFTDEQCDRLPIEARLLLTW